jgi:hypothetical protein
MSSSSGSSNDSTTVQAKVSFHSRWIAGEARVERLLKGTLCLYGETLEDQLASLVELMNSRLSVTYADTTDAASACAVRNLRAREFIIPGKGCCLYACYVVALFGCQVGSLEYYAQIYIFRCLIAREYTQAMFDESEAFAVATGMPDQVHWSRRPNELCTPVTRGRSVAQDSRDAEALLPFVRDLAGWKRFL